MEARYQIFLERELLISTTRDCPKEKFQAQCELVLAMSIKLFKTMWTTTSVTPTQKLATRNVISQDVVVYIGSEKLCKLAQHIHI